MSGKSVGIAFQSGWSCVRNISSSRRPRIFSSRDEPSKMFFNRASVTTQAHIRRQIGLVERLCKIGNRHVPTQNGHGFSCHALSLQDPDQKIHGAYDLEIANLHFPASIEFKIS